MVQRYSHCKLEIECKIRLIHSKQLAFLYLVYQETVLKLNVVHLLSDGTYIRTPIVYSQLTPNLSLIHI